jgi:hypothetical protein
MFVPALFTILQAIVFGRSAAIMRSRPSALETSAAMPSTARPALVIGEPLLQCGRIAANGKNLPPYQVFDDRAIPACHRLPVQKPRRVASDCCSLGWEYGELAGTDKGDWEKNGN